MLNLFGILYYITDIFKYIYIFIFLLIYIFYFFILNLNLYISKYFF